MTPQQYLSQLIPFPSVSSESNRPVNELIAAWLTAMDFELEWLDYRDDRGVLKSSLAARKGPAGRGMAYCGHTDVVPVQSWSFLHSGPWQPHVTPDRFYGRGSCDMKGSVACMLAAAEATRTESLREPLRLIITADEEIGMFGAAHVAQHSQFYRDMVRERARTIIGEPTSLDVVHAHKGAQLIIVTSRGRAAHSSTGLGLNANLAMIPFLAGLKTIHDEMDSDDRWKDHRFTPPHPTMNIGINDHNGALNITSPTSICTINFRPMPGQDADAAVRRIQELAERCGLEFELRFSCDPLFTDPDGEFVAEVLRLADRTHSRTVAYGTDGAVLTDLQDVVVLGPGDILQAHTDDEWVALDQLQRAAELYEKLIRHWCVG